MSATELADGYLRFFVLPLWIAAGFVDWLCHRRSQIASTSGLRESLLHVAQLVEVGIPLLVALLFEIDLTVLALMAAGFVLHEFTALADVRYAVSRRDVSPFEQHVHSFLEMMPLVALSLIAWIVLPARLRDGVQAADFALRWRPTEPLYIVVLLAAVLVFAVIPYAEECLRGWRYARRHAASR
ncbi:diguanylate cyclase [Burkholderia multivorans]|uniref:hypothetical protein n=1 Tax=Burkholderia TaxID=32008 RepID=UPI000278020C|nr:hypothetical protein [Burkholderia multivorans]EJO61292.1 hypothetical protein BURMUCF2_B0218 [Burkholderia multivorans CF2]KWH26751.1 diguanylate cyclase [Burkholderia multivorans]MBJ9657267.1 diguanylate cyclase [Burkholderia multivorans]MBR8047406.1 diguanylate cyclase [Burkholderia multivorans]MBR8126828.1 diguanylate cyclase [Burkholderia multivorans]